MLLWVVMSVLCIGAQVHAVYNYRARGRYDEVVPVPGFGGGGRGQNGYGGPCQYDVDCGNQDPQLYCDRARRMCDCKTDLGYYPSNTRDRCVARIGTVCTSRYECESLGEGAECVQGACVCGDDFVPSARSGICLKIATDFRTECKEDIQCSSKLGDLSFCSGKCNCKPESHQHKNKCYRSKRLNEQCDERSETERCFTGDDQPVAAECRGGRCKCRDGSVEVQGKCSNGGARTTALSFAGLISVVMILFAFK